MPHMQMDARVRRAKPTDITETPRHRPLPGGWEARPVVADAVAAYRKVRDAHKEAAAAQKALLGDLDNARKIDRAAIADALLAGKAEPAAKAEAKLRGDVEAAQRRLEALHEAADAAARSVDSAFKDDRQAWRDDARAKRAGHEAELVELFDRAGELLAGIEACRLTVVRTHPKATPGTSGERFSTKPGPGGRAPQNIVLALREWALGEWQHEDDHTTTGAAMSSGAHSW